MKIIFFCRMQVFNWLCFQQIFWAFLEWKFFFWQFKSLISPLALWWIAGLVDSENRNVIVSDAYLHCECFSEYFFQTLVRIRPLIPLRVFLHYQLDFITKAKNWCWMFDLTQSFQLVSKSSNTFLVEFSFVLPFLYVG